MDLNDVFKGRCTGRCGGGTTTVGGTSNLGVVHGEIGAD
jgi:hypothetical protein